MTRRLCAHTWPGEYPPFFKPGTSHAYDRHQCTRPPDHPDQHACICGDRS